MLGVGLDNTDGDKRHVTKIERIQHQYTARLERLKTGGTALVITIAVFRFIPDDDAASGMNTRYNAAVHHSTVTRRMETMVIKHIQYKMYRLAILKTICARTIAQ